MNQVNQLRSCQMKYNWLKDCYKENQLQLWMMNCLDENQFNDLMTKKQKGKLEIELQEKIINQIIAKNEYYSYRYARHVLQKPFPAGEPAIAKDLYWKEEYEKTFNIKL